MSNFEQFADRELRLLGFAPEAEEGSNKWMYENIMELVRVFGEQGHSGGSANYARSAFNLLANYQPLSPLTGADDEWGEPFDDGVRQNKRCFRVFKDAAGNAYDVDGKVFRENGGPWYTNKESRVLVTFPYVPKTEYVELP